MTSNKIIAKNVYLYSYANQYDIRVFRGDVIVEEDDTTYFVRDVPREDRRKVRVKGSQGKIYNNMFWLKKKDHKQAQKIFEDQAYLLEAKCRDLKELYGRMIDATKYDPKEMW